MRRGSERRKPSVSPAWRCVVLNGKTRGNVEEMPDSFSQRHRLAGPPLGTLVRDEVPTSFRMFLVNLPHAYQEISFHELQKVVCEVLQEWPDENLPPYYDYKRHIQKCEWFRIYEIIEGLYKLLCGKESAYHHYRSSFTEAKLVKSFDDFVDAK